MLISFSKSTLCYNPLDFTATTASNLVFSVLLIYEFFESHKAYSYDLKFWGFPFTGLDRAVTCNYEYVT